MVIWERVSVTSGDHPHLWRVAIKTLRICRRIRYNVKKYSLHPQNAMSLKLEKNTSLFALKKKKKHGQKQF